MELLATVFVASVAITRNEYKLGKCDVRFSEKQK